VSVVIGFSPSSASLSASARIALQVLAADLLPGDSLVVSGYASRNSTLAGRRALTVATFLTGLGETRITQRSDTTSANNKVVVNAR
jgi:outer membrane protein OmpA-like peptidoglycan-associated protein